MRLPVRPLRIKKIQDQSAAFVKRELLNIERLLRVSEVRVFVYAETVACGDELRIRGFRLLDDLGSLGQSSLALRSHYALFSLYLADNR
jgi:hypothetical protein